MSLTILTASSIGTKNKTSGIVSGRLAKEVFRNFTEVAKLDLPYLPTRFHPRTTLFSLLCRMQQLAFPAYDFRFKQDGETKLIFCTTRKKFVVLTPEEWVRQHVVQYLLTDLKYPKSLLNVEKLLKINGLSKRYDVVVYKPDGSVFLLVECKAPMIGITQSVFDQIARYNLSLSADFMMLTNGKAHYFCQMDVENQRYDFLRSLPEFPKTVS